ncbi:Hypothetical protein HVR_LOCUS898 [uncultured virus]|nr:Hypothetical protein HVR_LOCUS898 [uncultured virus]
MYWLRSSFTVASYKDLELLARIYKDVPGELDVMDSNDKNLLSVGWTEPPLSKLLENSNKEYSSEMEHSSIHSGIKDSNEVVLLQNSNVGFVVCPFTIVSRLDGPQTIIAVSPKLDPLMFDQENKDLLLKCADHMDQTLWVEMNRNNDMEYIIYIFTT